MLTLCLMAGCKGKKVYTETDIKKEEVLSPGVDVDWIGLYLRAHELDSLKNVAEVSSAKAGQPFEQLPDSINALWSNMMNEILLRRGNVAFDMMYNTHRDDIRRYLRLDFINYGFITKVYLPYKATVSTREQYGEICIEELEKEMEKANMTMMYAQQVPSHYEHLLKDLFYAYVNYDKNSEALAMCDQVLNYFATNYGTDTFEYANMLNNKASLLHKTGSTYSATITAKQALATYDKLLVSEGLDDHLAADILKEKEKLSEKITAWQQE